MKVTLKDIAKDTGYSVSTVSRVLNGSNKISDETKEEILESAERFNYLTPRVRNAEKEKTTLNIALIASGFHEGEFYIAFYHGINKAATRNNVRLFLHSMLDPFNQVTEIIRDIALDHYDGAILFVPEFTQNEYLKIREQVPDRFPIVTNALIETPVFPTITFDSYSGGYLAATHFKEKGYQRVGIINGPKNRSESRFRSNGFKDFISQTDSMNLVWSHDGDFTFETGVKAFEHFENAQSKPRAIFACNDDMANGFMEKAKQKRYDFPDDIAIIGYDNLPKCRHNQPTMSSIKTDYEELGTATMKILRDRLSNPNHNSSMVSFVPVSIVARESS